VSSDAVQTSPFDSVALLALDVGALIRREHLQVGVQRGVVVVGRFEAELQPLPVLGALRTSLLSIVFV
jgi:hypothetical protein